MPKTTNTQNPQINDHQGRTVSDLRNEADHRLSVARELLMGIGALPSATTQVEDAQAACSAGAMLIGDSIDLLDSATALAKKEG